jgi:hypothetical protein
MKTVHICGLFRQDLREVSQADLTQDGAQVWTVNDWYRCYPWMKPHRVFNLHTMKYQEEWIAREENAGRYPGDWLEKYRRFAKKGTEFVLVEDWQIPGAILLPAEALMQSFPVQYCGISAMILMAVLEGYERISLLGVRLRDSEYKYQISGISAAIRIARSRNIEAIVPHEAEWEARQLEIQPEVALLYDTVIACLADKLRADTENVQYTEGGNVLA